MLLRVLAHIILIQGRRSAALFISLIVRSLASQHKRLTAVVRHTLLWHRTTQVLHPFYELELSLEPTLAQALEKYFAKVCAD